MRTVSEKSRKAAIEACELLAEASITAEPSRFWGHKHKPVSELYSYEETGDRLALTAWSAVFDALGGRGIGEADRYSPDTYLEAAALLRDGWNPGEPVEVRNA